MDDKFITVSSPRLIRAAERAEDRILEWLETAGPMLAEAADGDEGIAKSLLITILLRLAVISFNVSKKPPQTLVELLQEIQASVLPMMDKIDHDTK